MHFLNNDVIIGKLDSVLLVNALLTIKVNWRVFKGAACGLSVEVLDYNQVNSPLPKNTNIPLQCERLVCSFWATVETQRCNMA